MTPIALAVSGFMAGLLLGTNPTLISSFTAFIASMLGRKTPNSRLVTAGFLFLLYFTLFLMFFSVAFTSIFISLNIDYQQTVLLLTAIVGVGVGVSLIRRYFWHEDVIKPPLHVRQAIHDKTTKGRGIINLISLALVVAYATLPTIGVAIVLFSGIGLTVGSNAMVWSVPFGIGLITPIYAMLALLSNKTKPSAILAWKEKTKSTMRLYNGLTLIALAWLLLLLTTEMRWF